MLNGKGSLPLATHEGILTLDEDIKIFCAVLEDGTRLLTQAEFVRAIGRKGNVKKSEVFIEERGASVPIFLSANNLQPFVTNELLEVAKPIPFITTNNVYSIGYRAEFLPQICNVFIDVKDAGALKVNQIHIAERCKLLLRAYATVGIIALVDEATGYQDQRARDALERILEKYLSDHQLKWAKTFPDDFYREMYRLKGWDYSGYGFHSRPGVVGRYTNDIVYERLAPGVLKKLEELNPKNESGNRSTRHHQWFTEDHGVPELKSHLSGVIALMKASNSWRGFQRMIARVYPKINQQYELPIEWDD